MGTYYAVTFQGDGPQNVKSEIEQLLIEFNNSLSTYIPTSLISKFNDSDAGIPLPDADPYFEPVLARADQLKEMTDGRLNTAIMPLIKYWRDNDTAIDSAKVEKLTKLVNQSETTIETVNGSSFIRKSDPATRLDFSSLAKGYGIDVIAQYLSEQGVENYLVDIGGESRAKGKNKTGQAWTLAINKPKEGAGLRTQELVLQLQDKSIATSGTYRQFYQKDGKKIAHILDPLSGLSIDSDLLSASVIADDCMTADGLATAMMIYNLAGAKDFLSKHDYPALLIYDGDGDENFERYYANGFDAMVVNGK